MGAATSPTRIPAASGVEQWRTSQSLVTPVNTTQITPEFLIGLSTTQPVDFTLAIYAPNLKLGPNINDPPILQTSGLAATRTASAPQISGITGPPVGAILAEWEQPLPRGASSTASTYVWSINDGGDTSNANFCLRARRGALSDESIAAVIGNGTGITVVTAPASAPGTINRALISYDATRADSKFTLNGAEQNIGQQVVAGVLQNAVLGLGNAGAQRGNVGQFNSALRRLIWLPYFPDQAERVALTT